MQGNVTSARLKSTVHMMWLDRNRLCYTRTKFASILDRGAATHEDALELVLLREAAE